jgi:predicted amidohydrolase
MRDRGIATKRETKLQSRREVSGRDRPEDGCVAAGSHMRCTALVGGCSSELEQLQQRLDVRIGATGDVAPVLIEANLILYNKLARCMASKVMIVTLPTIQATENKSLKLEIAADYARRAAVELGRLDVVLLPDALTSASHESLTAGLIVGHMSALARQLRSYVIAPIRELRADNTSYNTAVLIDRAGATLGVYRQSFPASKGIHPSPDGVRLFELDFGRAAILLSWDQHFAELWQAAGALGADVVFWPESSPTIDVLAAAARHNYFVAGSSVDSTPLCRC